MGEPNSDNSYLDQNDPTRGLHRFLDQMGTKTLEDSNLTLRKLLLRRTSSESDKTNRPLLKLPKLNVVEITKVRFSLVGITFINFFLLQVY